MHYFQCLRLWLVILILGSVPAWADSFAWAANDLIVDSAGRRVSVTRPFTRIISLYAAHTENLYALGAGSAIVGVSRSSQDPAAATTKKQFSYRDDPERFLAVRPDLVLIRPMIDRAYPRLFAQLEKQGITVVSLQPTTVDAMMGYWQILGRLVGREENAHRMITAFQQAVDTITTVTAPITPKKRVYFEAMHAKMRTFTPSAMAMFALTTAGGINVAHEAQSVRGTNIAFFGKERILAHADEIDIYLAQHGPMNRSTVAQIQSEPGFDQIKAIRENQVYIIDEAIVSRPTPRIIQGVCQIGVILYPKLFSEQLTEYCQ